MASHRSGVSYGRWPRSALWPPAGSIHRQPAVTHPAAGCRLDSATHRIANATNSFRSAKISPGSPARRHRPPRDAHFPTSTMDSIGTSSKSLPKTIWKAIALAELPPFTQQLVKNLFFGAGAALFLRKGAEATLVPVAEVVPRQNSAFWRSTSMWSNGALGFMVQSGRVHYYDGTGPRNIGWQQGRTARCNSPGSFEATTRSA